jgi:hypothetical protein
MQKSEHSRVIYRYPAAVTSLRIAIVDVGHNVAKAERRGYGPELADPHRVGAASTRPTASIGPGKATDTTAGDLSPTSSTAMVLSWESNLSTGLAPRLCLPPLGRTERRTTFDTRRPDGS